MVDQLDRLCWLEDTVEDPSRDVRRLALYILDPIPPIEDGEAVHFARLMMRRLEKIYEHKR